MVIQRPRSRRADLRYVREAQYLLPGARGDPVLKPGDQHLHVAPAHGSAHRRNLPRVPTRALLQRKQPGARLESKRRDDGGVVNFRHQILQSQRVEKPEAHAALIPVLRRDVFSPQPQPAFDVIGFDAHGVGHATLVLAEALVNFNETHLVERARLRRSRPVCCALVGLIRPPLGGVPSYTDGRLGFDAEEE